MPRKRLLLSGIVVLVVAIAAGLALLQLARHELQGRDAIDDLSAQDPSGTAEQRGASACTSAQGGVAPPRAPSAAHAESSVILQLDYAGAEALIDALERDSLSAADVDSLFRIRGLCAMVDNVPRFFPGIGVSQFRKEIRAFVRTKKGGKYDGYFDLGGVWRARPRLRALIATIQANERQIAGETISQLAPYRPDSGTLVVTVHFVAGGVSDGFAFENDPTSFYANLARSDGDVNGIVLNMAHEAYHVMQFRAQARAGIDPLSLSTDATPPVERLFATTLSEGTAEYVVDPTRWTATGSAMDSARRRYQRNADPKRIAENFARFDAVLAALRSGRMAWDEAYRQGFTSTNDASFYFVGYEMSKAIERYCGRECITRLFRKPPVEFFRQYVALCHAHPEISGRFSKATEAFIAADVTKPAR